jgi:hypothetical protein
MAFYNFKAHSLPLQTTEYNQGQINQLANALRLYFNRLDSAFLNLSGPTGGAALQLPYGAFYSTATQTAALINTAYPVTLNTTVVHNNIDLEPANPSRVTVNIDGAYNFQAILQLNNNSATTTGYIWIWARINGVDVPFSANKVELSFTAPNEQLSTVNFVLELQASNYFQLMWATDNLNCELLSEAATAFGPAIPSVILTTTFVSAPYA